MSFGSEPKITELLLAWGEGDETALEQLIPLVYQELHRLARHYMRQEQPGHTLETTALINEAYLRLVDTNRVPWQNRSHFYAICARAMRRILIDHAKSRHRAKRGGGAREVSLDEVASLARDRSAELVLLDEALKRLEAFDKRKSQVVELRFFGGLSIEETAEVMKISTISVSRDWNTAKAWLYREISGKEPDDTGTVAAD
jgi:RNA polymerase sigma-70 factor (ECF subfamily)